jgi:endonuclease YncB( thermonuclease family)
MKAFNSQEPYMIVFVFVFAFICGSLNFVSCQTMTGNGAQWIDADTVGFRTVAGKYYRARLSGIDAPELRQTHGLQCKMILMQAIQGKTTTMGIFCAARQENRVSKRRGDSSSK